MEYELIRSSRKTLSVEIRTDSSVLVRAPLRCPRDRIEGFLWEKREWIQKKIALQSRREQSADKVRPLSDAAGRLYRERAREVFEQRCAYYAPLMGVTYNRIAIRDQKTRWGSCSSRGNLNFNWRLTFAPAGVLDYVVIHELAHRREMNHSAMFWQIVEDAMPDYRKYELWLKENGRILHRY